MCRSSLLYYSSHTNIVTTIAYTLLARDTLQVLQVDYITELTKPTLVSTIQRCKRLSVAVFVAF